MRHHQPDEGDGTHQRHRGADADRGPGNQRDLGPVGVDAQVARLGLTQQQGIEGAGAKGET